MIRVSAHTMLASGSLALLAACSDATRTVAAPDDGPGLKRAGYDTPGVHRQYGVPQKIGGEMVRSYVVLDAKAGNTPLEVGVALDAKALEGLPSTPRMLHLALPAAAPEPYTFVMFDWNPQGHPPASAYGVPHFDFHFYTIPESEVAAIVPSNPDWEANANDWPTDVPPFYAPPVPPGQGHTETAPMMGLHWLDLRSPELQLILPSPPGDPDRWAAFTRTFIYGSWAGNFIFLEPMVTLDHLRSMPNDDILIPQPTDPAAAFGKSGWYPSRYRITYDTKAREYRIAIAGLTERH